MKVRLLAPGRSETGERRLHGFQTVGREYVVLAIIASNERGVQLLLLADDTDEPGWHPASDYDLVSDEVPSNWRIRVGDAGHVDCFTIAPRPWLERGFFEDYWSEDPVRGGAAEDTFQRELDFIIRETG